MNQTTTAKVTLGVLCVLFLMLSFNTVAGASQAADIQILLRHVTARKTTMTSEWVSIGIAVGLTTHLGELALSETDTEHAERHRRGVDAMLTVFPKQE